MKEERGINTGRLIDVLEGLGIRVKMLAVREEVDSMPEVFIEGCILTPEDYRE
ncbi:MAG: hypothetical protein PHW03_09775 [Eubacteriales bacterium]|nr:hypothetical protein [Eubacteriales bacterium]